MTTSKKTCIKCKSTLSLDAYYRHPMMKDGRLNKCIECTKSDVKSHRRSEKYREKVLAYDRARGNRQSNEYLRKHRAENPKANKARAMVGRAVKDGTLQKPNRCQQCGENKGLHGHHYDYDKPLSVIWLCAACHHQLHAFMDLVEKAKQQSTTF